MARSVTMVGGRHEVMNVQTAAEYRVMDDNRLMGDLRISRGGAFWRPTGAAQYLQVSWADLDKFFKANGEKRSVGEYNHAPPPKPDFDEF